MLGLFSASAVPFGWGDGAVLTSPLNQWSANSNDEMRSIEEAGLAESECHHTETEQTGRFNLANDPTISIPLVLHGLDSTHLMSLKNTQYQKVDTIARLQ